MTGRHVPRNSTEAAIRLIRLTAADIQSAMVRVPVGRIVRATSVFGSEDLADALKQAHYLRLVSIAEIYTDVLMSELLGERLPTNDELIAKLMATAELASSSSWPRRSEFFNRLHGIKLDEFDRNAELNAAKRVRNIVAHGLGRITSKEMENSRLGSQLSLIGVRIQDRRVIITEQSLVTLSKLTIDYITWLDEKAGA
ncbi:hypothetical protein [Micromonospora inyonensis]|nr:hypothetical protein [Micromonospora inyonensis]